MDKEFKNKLIKQIGVAVIIMVVLVFIILLVKRDINKRAEATQDMKQEIAMKSQISGSLANLRKDAEKASKYFQVLSNRLPDRDELINFPKEMLELGDRQDVQVGVSVENELGPESGLSGISFALTSQSSFDNFIKFLQAVENHRYFVQFQSFNLIRNNVEKKGEFQGVVAGNVFSKTLQSENQQ